MAQNWFSNLCPGCRRGRIFKKFVFMNPACPDCGRVFEKESGYFIGAMIASYFLGTLAAFPLLIAMVFLWGQTMTLALFASCALILALQPILFRYSRILWIQIEAALTRSIHSGGKP
jgi:uncharacterized protein (DUF983 family)